MLAACLGCDSTWQSNEYLSEMRARGSVRAVNRSGWLLDDIWQSCPRVYLQAITRGDVME